MITVTELDIIRNYLVEYMDCQYLVKKTVDGIFCENAVSFEVIDLTTNTTVFEGSDLFLKIIKECKCDSIF